MFVYKFKVKNYKKYKSTKNEKMDLLQIKNCKDLTKLSSSDNLMLSFVVRVPTVSAFKISVSNVQNGQMDTCSKPI